MSKASDLMTIAFNPAFQNRVKYYLQSAAIAVGTEAGNTAYHSFRTAYADKVLLGTASIVDAAIAVLTNATIAAEANLQTTPDYAIPDGDIQFAVNTIFTSLAGGFDRRTK